MRIPILMIFQFITIIGAWSAKALEDGKITAEEGLELVQSLAMIIGVPLELEVPSGVKEVIENPSNKSDAANVDKFLEASKIVRPEEPAKD